MTAFVPNILGNLASGVEPLSKIDGNFTAVQTAIQNGTCVTVGTIGGTVNAITGLTIGAAPPSLAVGQYVFFVPVGANTAATTFNRDGLGALSIFYNGSILGGGELQANIPALMFNDGTQYHLLSIPPGILQNSKSANYTTILSDANRHILHPTADNNPRTFTIDSNANVAYRIGTAISFVNQINTLTIAITSDTMTLAGAGTTGSRTLAASGIATALKIASTSWIISGVGLT